MSFLRHVGKIGDRKVAIIFREIPGEPHMCLIVHTETLNAQIHDALIQCVESDIGQSSEHLADALNRSYTQDGKIILQLLHREGLLKKVQTAQVIVTPSPTTSIKLDELNKMLDEMKQGEEAVKRLAEIDQSSGMKTPAEVARKLRGDKTPPAKVTAQDGLLGDSTLADSLRQQAMKMAAEAKGLLAESDRLLKEAAQMDPVKATPVKATKKKTTKVEAVAETVKPAKAPRKVKTTA